MSIVYLDFENINVDTTRDIDCSAQLNLSTSIPINNFNKISISKIDLDCGDNWYFCRVPLKQPQTYKGDPSTDYIDNYDMQDSNSKYIFNHANGWFETIYRFVICYKDSNNDFTYEEFPFLYKSNEIDFNYASIGKTETPASSGDYVYDNFDDYFCSYNANNMLNSFNECLKYVISDRLGISDTQIINLMPKFHTNDKQLIIDNFSYSDNNNMQDKNNDILQVQYPEEVDAGTYPGHTTPGPMFCFGINKIANNLLYHGLVSKKYDNNNALLSSLSEEYYFLQLDKILETSFSIPDINNDPNTPGNDIYYNITSQYVNEFYDMGDIKLIVIKGNLPVPPLYSIRKQKNYYLTNDLNTKTSDVAENVIFKLSINNNTLVPTRFIFQQPNIKGNYSAIIGGLNGTNYNISIEYIDKYNNSIPALLSYGDKIFVQLAVYI